MRAVVALGPKWLAAVLVAASIAADAASRPGPSPSPTPRVRVESSNSNISVVNDGGSFGLSCAPASSSAGGCLTTGNQSIAGAKTLDSDLYVLGSQYIGGLIRTAVNGQGIVLDGRRQEGDVAAEVTIRGVNNRTAGEMVRVVNGAGVVVLTLDRAGVLSLTGPEAAGTAYGQILDATGVAGHHVMTSSPGVNLTVSGKFNDPTAPYGLATLPDGGRAPDGGFFPYAGRHGELTVAATFSRVAGMLQDWQNPTSGVGAYEDKKAFIDFAGGFGQAGGLNRADFGVCPSDLVLTNIGQYRYGHEISVLLYANDKSAWYSCTAAGWRRVGQQLGTITLVAGSGTATVEAGAVCVCANTSAETAPRCSVASTTLTATLGATTNVITYSCGVP